MLFSRPSLPLSSLPLYLPPISRHRYSPVFFSSGYRALVQSLTTLRDFGCRIKISSRFESRGCFDRPAKLHRVWIEKTSWTTGITNRDKNVARRSRILTYSKQQLHISQLVLFRKRKRSHRMLHRLNDTQENICLILDSHARNIQVKLLISLSFVRTEFRRSWVAYVVAWLVQVV